MRELTKHQKIKVIDEMILGLKENTSRALCHAYNQALEFLKYKPDYDIESRTPGFKELNDIIHSEIIRTGGGIFINYDNWAEDRIDLLKKVRKQL